MSDQPGAFENSTITARGPVSGVTVHAHMRHGPHAIIGHSLDLTIIVELMFLLAEQARRKPSEPPLTVTPASVLERLREAGVKSGNGSRLIGRDAVYESFARLRGKNYLRRITHRVDNKVAGVSYEFYEFPAWNPDPLPMPAEASPQVGAASGIAGSGNAGSRSKNRASQSSPQVGAASWNAGSGNAGSRSARTASSQVRATSGNGVHPPHPPEEVDTSSPYPLTATATDQPSQTEEEVGSFTEEDIQAASRFLQMMKKPWNAGRATAKKCAPLLLEAMRDQGWPSIHGLSDIDRLLLERDITKNPERITSHAHVLPKRIADLSLYAAVVPAARKTAPRGQEGGCTPQEEPAAPLSARSITSLLDGLQKPSV